MNFEEVLNKANDLLIDITTVPGKSKSYMEWHRLLNKVEYRSMGIFIREVYVTQLSMSIITTEEADALAEALAGKKVCEIGAGTGYLAKLLLQRGIDIHPFDNLSNSEVPSDNDGVVIIKDSDKVDLSLFDVIIMAWPDYEDRTALSVASRMKAGQELYYLGEGKRGCCAEDGFFDYVELNFNKTDDQKEFNEQHIKFDSIYDSWHTLVKS